MPELPTHLKGRDFLRISDWSPAEIAETLDLASELKLRQQRSEEHRLLPGRTVGLIFHKVSTRTRVSFGAGLNQLGAAPLTLSTADMQLSRGETLRDTANVLSRYLDAIVIRTFRQADVDFLAEHATIPVINGLTDDAHPCQALADALTIRERFGGLEGVRLAYIGDGNNTCASLMTIAAMFGARFVAAIPDGYEPSELALALARGEAERSGATIEIVRDPREAASGADVLYTDVWTSMGQEEEAERRKRDFSGYLIDDALVALTSPRGIVMHDLPAHYGEEITEEVVYGPRSAVWEQAENRLHAQKALLALIVP